MTHKQLKVSNLYVSFQNKKSRTNILHDVSFDVEKGETLCIVGESGCGKSLTSLSVMGLLPKNGVVEKGTIQLGEENLLTKTKKEMSHIRGNQLSMIFQEPMTSLNPVHTVGRQIAENISIHNKVTKRAAAQKAVEMLELVGIPSPEERASNYPHQLSGGMRQRVMIAMALSCNPSVLIADEPTTALDVTIQAQILELLDELKQKIGMSIVMITHDLGVVSAVADRVLVMYAGKVVETSSVEELLHDPKHPYTEGLIASIPKLDDVKEELATIPGSVPLPHQMPTGCRFSSRCPYAHSYCEEHSPPLDQIGKAEVACWRYHEIWHQLEKEAN
ncbi:ABC transporter ATP-binding protein [Alkalicoccobacillus porphyridii]|uniref:ABC transporter ATP-binding protein n=1 Tax=Alkalicoccobacillus porphyridii TaxID=2597270 RepID=A0A553ZWA0_9BACI|nr:ABC transporter ATP-binding protein [Alkalicoccobacillus porphyridii]TSB45754.1 ABC transporter ATP-binding protein [Alkalicoccobacillus porphyridii]